MQRSGLVAMGAFAFLVLAPTVTARADQGRDGDEVLLDDVGSGWSPAAECPQVDGPNVEASSCFTPDDAASADWLLISASPVPAGLEPGDHVKIMAEEFGGEPFETPGLDIAEGRGIRLDSQTLLNIVMITENHLFSLTLMSGIPRPDAETFLLDVTRRQQDEAGQPAKAPETEVAGDHELDRLLLTPARASEFETMYTVDPQLDLDDLRSEARSQAVVDVLSGAPARTRVLSLNGVPAVLVTLEEMPYDMFAATAIGSLADLPRDRLLTLGPGRLPHAVGLRLPVDGGDGLGVAFRKGRYVALLVIRPIYDDQDGAMQALLELATLQADLLPDGETTPYFFPSAATSLAVTVGTTTAICGGAFAAGRLAAATGRRRTRLTEARKEIPSSEPHQVVDVTRSGMLLRRRGLTLAAADLAALNVLVAGTLGLTGVLRMPVVLTLTLLVIGALGGILFTAWWGRAELRQTHLAHNFAPALRPSVSGVIGGAIALALLVLGLAVLANGLAGLAFGPSLSGLERSKQFGVDPTLLNLAALVVGVVLLALGGFAVRLARTRARTTAERLRARDRRPPILYLRSFEDDRLKLPAIVSARRPFLELFAARGTDTFEESIAWQVAPYGPVVAIGRPGRSLQSLGAARDHLADDVWRDGVSERMATARAIVVILGSTEGLRWEIAQLVSGEHLDRTVFVFPPATADVVRDRWWFTAESLAAAGVQVPTLPVAAERILAAVHDRSGVWRVAVADVRDEATFRAGLDQAMEWLTEAPGAGSPIVTSPSRQPE